MILEKEFLVGERTTDIRLEAQAFVQHVLHLRLECDVAVLARRLGVVHGDVRVAQQRLGAAFGRGEGDADARCDAYLDAIERERQIQCLDQRVGQTVHVCTRCDPLQQNGELVSAEPRNGVRGTGRLDDPLCDRLQQAIAGVMTE